MGEIRESAGRRWVEPGLVAGCGLLAGAVAPSAAHLFLLVALVLCLGVPLLVAESSCALTSRALPFRALWGTLGALAGAGLLGVLRFPPAGVLLACAYLGSGALALAGLTRWSRRGGQALATGLGLSALAGPYLVGALGLSAETTLGLVLHSPLPILVGTCAGEDLLRQGSLYRLLPAAQSLPYAYPSAQVALLSALALAGLAWAPAAWGRLRGLRVRVPAPALALALGALLLAAPQEAAAQGLFPSPGGADPYAAGSLETRVRLGYYLPELRGFVRVDPARRISSNRRGDEIDFLRKLDLAQQFVVPTFEVELAWPNVGGLRVQYLEALYQGETQSQFQILQFEEQRINVSNVLNTRYRFRTVALGGHVDIPLAEFITLKVMSTFRYVKNEIRIRATPQGISVRNSQESIVPTIGAGIDVFIWNVISVYGDIQWLDFRTSILGAEDSRWRFHYREWRAGVRLELIEHAHVMVEWYSLTLGIRDYFTEEYLTDLQGLRVMVSIQF